MEPTTQVIEVTNILHIPQLNFRCIGVYSEAEKAKTLAKFPHAGDVYFNVKTNSLYIQSAPARILDVIPSIGHLSPFSPSPDTIREVAGFIASHRTWPTLAIHLCKDGAWQLSCDGFTTQLVYAQGNGVPPSSWFTVLMGDRI